MCPKLIKLMMMGMVLEVCDNCPGVANVLLCCFVQDNCQYVSNTDQADDDGDGIGAVCDNCPGVANVL